MSLDRFKITWDRGAYYVSVPNYQGGEVVPVHAVDRLLDALKPFAELADICDHFHHPDSRSVCKTTIDGVPHPGPTAGDCRAARKAYASLAVPSRERLLSPANTALSGSAMKTTILSLGRRSLRAKRPRKPAPRSSTRQ